MGLKQNIPELEIARLLAEEASEQDIAIVEEWVSSNSENQEILAEYIDAYNYQPQKVEFNSVEAFKKLSYQLDKETPVRKMPLSISMFYRVAASLLLFAICGILLFGLSKWMISDELVVKSNPFGQKSTIQLSDGTIVKLNSGSKLSYPAEFHGNERKVYLEGEAFFDVTRDTEHPFLVITKNLTTQVLGTSFNINAFDSTIKVTVATGKVKVSEIGGQQVILNPNDQAVYHKAGRLTKKEVLLATELAWTENTLRFEEASIQLIAKQLEMWYGIPINIEDVVGANCSVTGNYKDENLINVLEAISWSTGLSWKRTQDEIQLKGKCN
ncbi:FecR family protein [Fulvivirga lutea]|uniref:FecR domain-containing protein n=1 Tax=Fulvivirga lutea TaxID=2810512 RepID=A0A974WHF2_9BACT|nr:FecR family protein [Fulvivirga lutea]QSE96170.1 FecR domain-containing protein [Fulvivirga lutea]